jgi:8-oxo-(d)GTP phosphatase
MKDASAQLIKAAGGVLCLAAEAGPRFAVVHKSKYDTWGLPKGKLSNSEDWVEAALREVAEETGAIARILGPRTISSYFVEGIPKVVVWYLMGVVDARGLQESDEIDAADWLDEREALNRLTHAAERRVFKDLVAHLGDEWDR